MNKDEIGARWKAIFSGVSDTEVFAINDVAMLLDDCFKAVLPQCSDRQEEIERWLLRNNFVIAHSWIELANRKLATAAQE